MGANSTLRITAEAARKYLLNELLNASNETLEQRMDAALSDRLYNVRIVSEDGWDGNDDERL